MTTDINREISERGVRLSMMDLRDLRSRYSRTIGAPMYRVANLKRSFIVLKLLEAEFGDDFLEYEKQCKQWREFEQDAIDAWTANVEQMYDQEPTVQ